MALGLTIHILGSVAEHKAEMISSRTKAALVAAKARGVKLGGDKGTIGFKAMLGAKARALGARSQSAEAEQPYSGNQGRRRFDASKSCIQTNERAIASPNGGRFYARRRDGLSYVEEQWRAKSKISAGNCAAMPTTEHQRGISSWKKTPMVFI
jgi:hypothetical protein